MGQAKILSEEDRRRIDFTNKWNLQQSRLLISVQYPNVELISCDLSFNYNGAMGQCGGKGIQKTFSPNDKAYFGIDCVNPTGINCDLNLDKEIRSMIAQKTTLLSGKKFCQGWQDVERINTYHCNCEMSFEIKIKFI